MSFNPGTVPKPRALSCKFGSFAQLQEPVLLQEPTQDGQLPLGRLGLSGAVVVRHSMGHPCVSNRHSKGILMTHIED